MSKLFNDVHDVLGSSLFMIGSSNFKTKSNNNMIVFNPSGSLIQLVNEYIEMNDVYVDASPLNWTGEEFLGDKPIVGFFDEHDEICEIWWFVDHKPMTEEQHIDFAALQAINEMEIELGICEVPNRAMNLDDAFKRINYNQHSNKE